MTMLRKANIGALHRCDGIGTPAEDGDYVMVSIQVDRERQVLARISLGAAALLVDELRGCLSAAGGEPS